MAFALKARPRIFFSKIPDIPFSELHSPLNYPIAHILTKDNQEYEGEVSMSDISSGESAVRVSGLLTFVCLRRRYPR